MSMAPASSAGLRNPVIEPLRFGLWLLLALLLVLADQWTKGLAVAGLVEGRPQVLLPVLNLSLHYNSGAAFSFLEDAGGWQRWAFSAVALGISVVLCVWLSRLRREEWLLACSLSFILGGAVGNLWDRVRLGQVVDFISVHYGGWYFPTFNLADSAISVGAGLMILDAFLQWRREESVQ
jgi:signal peptidase II